MKPSRYTALTHHTSSPTPALKACEKLIRWLTSAALVLRKLKQEDGNKFKASLGGHTGSSNPVRYRVAFSKRRKKRKRR